MAWLCHKNGFVREPAVGVNLAFEATQRVHIGLHFDRGQAIADHQQVDPSTRPADFDLVDKQVLATAVRLR